MLRRLLLVVLLLAVNVLHAADTKPSREQVDKAVAALVKAFNEGKSKDLHPLCDKGIQEKLPVTQMEQTLRRSQLKYGKIVGDLEEAKPAKDWRVYRAKGEKQPFYLKVRLNADGQFSGWGMTPAFLHELPSGPLPLADVQSRLTAAVEHSLRVYRVPSVSLALVKGDQIVWTHALGYQNLAKQVPADTETVYCTGSIIKVVVATALMQLVDEGILDLDKPVNEYLKGLQVPNSFEKDTPLTTRHLLSHHAGLTPYGAQLVGVWRRELPTPVEELLKKRAKVVSKPGEKFTYSNLGYTLNAYLLGQVRGTSFETAIKNRLLEPLEMTRTAFEPTPAMAENFAVPYENGVDGKVVPANRVRLDVYPAGDVYATPTDLAHFLLLHLNGGKYNGKQLLSPASVAAMTKPQFAAKGARTGVGLGWVIGSFHGRPLLWHNGAVPGFYTYVAAEPERRLGVVLFSNKYNPLEVAFNMHVDPLVDLRDYALELLDRLEAPTATKQP